MRRYPCLNPLQFIHAWLFSRVLVGTCARPHVVDSSSVLIVAPHPDDETLGCGGLIAAKRALGADVTLLFLTDGSAGVPPQTQGSDQNLIFVRQSEAIAAADQLHVDPTQVLFWTYADGDLENLSTEARIELVTKLATLMRTQKIRAVYAPHRRDGHPDHQSAFDLTLCALARLGPNIKLFQYPIWMWWTQPLGLRLQWQDLTRRSLHRAGAALEQKRRALRCHVSQWRRFPYGFLKAFPFENELFFEVDVPAPRHL